MDELIALFKDNLMYTILCSALILLLIWNVIISIQLGRLKGKYKYFMRGSKNANLEQIIDDYMHSIDNTAGKLDIIGDDLMNLKDRMDRCIQKCHIIRYNAFSNTGSDLSYSIALLDSYNNGFILSSIYGRDESVTYAKPIESGKCSYPLSVEEEIVLNRCLKVVL